MTTITEGQSITITTDETRRYTVKRVRVVSELGDGRLLIHCVSGRNSLTFGCDNALNVWCCIVNHKPYMGRVSIA